MTGRFAPGAQVQTPFGKGVVLEVRNGGRVLVDVGGRSLVLEENGLSAVEGENRPRRAGRIPTVAVPAKPKEERGARREVDLHGLTVQQAIARAGEALNEALLADASELRLIHGRSGGRIRAAVQEWLTAIGGVRFRVDERNPGVTIVSL